MNVKFFALLVGIFLVCSVVECQTHPKSQSKHENKPLIVADQNWTMVLEGEWMLEFMAPWCPACRAFKDVWAEFAGWSHDLDISVGVVDVTENPGLSGRFLIASLPTIYHIKDGSFRRYIGGRKTTDLISVIDEKKWEKIEPVAWYRDPNSFLMGFLGYCFKVAMVIRGFYSTMVEIYGIPEWACYIIFAILTIITGLLLGLLLVVCCDNFFPAKYIPLPPEQPHNLTPSQDDSDLIDDTEDKSESSKNSGQEKESPTEGPRKRNVNTENAES